MKPPLCAECSAPSIVGLNGEPLCLEHFEIRLKQTRSMIDSAVRSSA
ncbi:MAG TPA: hypothetical protein VFF67_03280 [Thermoplasmata archaeon]|nr:hypothetical protein [Thermoplasmata archaeon]